MKAFVDPDLCTACGLCASSCPKVFRMGSSVAEAMSGPVPAGEQSCARAAAEECPVEAIRIEE